MLRKAILQVLALLSCIALAGPLPGRNARANEDTPHTTFVPFFTFGGMLLLRATVDGREGYFILDTGAPTLILNQKYFPGTVSTDAYQETAFGLNGEIKRVLTKDADLELGGRKWKNIYAVLCDLEYLEEAKGIAILGLIGSLIFRRFELEIDFEKQQMVIHELDRRGEKIEASTPFIPPDVTVPFRQKGHIPYIEAYVEGLPLQLGIDSGAGIALIVNKKYSALSPFAERGELIRIRGLSQRAIQTELFYLRNLSVANLTYSTLKVAFTDLDYINDHFAGLELDGILGLDMLSHHRMAINFEKREIHIWAPAPDDEQLVFLNRKNGDKNSGKNRP